MEGKDNDLEISSKGFYTTLILNILGGSNGLSSESVSRLLNEYTLNYVSPTNLPNIVCLLFNHSHLSNVIKNYDSLSLGFELALFNINILILLPLLLFLYVKILIFDEIHQ